ncbi:MAG: tol-pal system protein YbgF [Burkholderiales bacterium]
MARIVASLLAVIAMSGAAPVAAGLFDDDEARARIAELRRDYDANQKVVADRLSRIEAAVQDRSALVDLAKMLEELRVDMSRLRGNSEVLLNRAENLEKRQRDLYVDLDSRLRKIEQGQQQLEQAQVQIQERLVTPEREAAQEKQVYESALNQFKVGNYQSSIAAFQTFMASYAASQLVPSAQYWVGNAYYALRDYKAAIAAQQKVVLTWPDNAKASDAMLNIASSQAELGDQKGTLLTLKTLVTKYPQSPAAEQAKQRLGGRR